MILPAALMFAFSLLLARRSLTTSATQSRRVIRLILSSCLFFSSFFFLVQQLAAERYITIVHEPWLASLSSEAGTITLRAGDRTSVPVLVENYGTNAFDSTLRSNPVYLSFHILGPEGEMILFDNPRFAFSDPLRPKQQQAVVAIFDNETLKLNPGRYIAEFDLVREGDFWFAARSHASRTLRIPLLIEGDDR